MCFKYVIALLLIPVQLMASDDSLSSGSSEKPTSFLQAKPNICVALREGRPCFSQVEFSWSQPDNKAYCLRMVDSKQIIGCWESNSSPTLLFQFESSTTAVFELVDQQSGDPIASTEVQVQWVYTQRQKKRRWRLF